MSGPESLTRTYRQMVAETKEAINSRGILRSPQLPSRFSSMMDWAVKRVFWPYLREDHPPVTFTLSPLINPPNEPNNNLYRFEIAVPSTVNEADKDFYRAGIEELAECTNHFATYTFIDEISQNTKLEKAAALYNRSFPSRKTYESYANGFTALSQISRFVTAKKFKDSILMAHFGHDFTLLNMAIREARIENVQNIDELAVTVGRKKGGAELRSWRGIPRAKSAFARLKNKLRFSFDIAGRAENQPGVVELTLTSPLTYGLICATSPAVANMVVGRDINLNLVIVGGVIGLLFDSLFIPMKIIHESMHSYSADENYIGLMPIRWVKQS